MTEYLSVVASILSIAAAIVSIISARKATSAVRRIEQNRASGGIVFQNSRAIGNKGDGFSIKQRT